MSDNNSHFFDKNTVIAMIAVVVVYLGWQKFLDNKYPDYKNVTTQSKTTTQVDTQPEKVITHKDVVPQEVIKNADIVEKKLYYKGDNINFSVSSFGMGLNDVSLSSYFTQDHELIKLTEGSSAGLFAMSLLTVKQPIYFNILEKEPGHFYGEAKVGGSTIARDIVYNKESNSFKNTISIKNPNEEIMGGFVLSMNEQIHSAKNKSWFFPSYEVQNFFSVLDGKTDTIKFNDVNENINIEKPTVSLVAMSSQYFSSSILEKSDILPSVKFSSNNETNRASALLIYKPLQKKEELEFTQIFYIGPKLIDSLKNIDQSFVEILDYGYFGIIARPLLYLMKFFQSFAGNWGIAIILLTLTVRVIVLPFNIMSTRSMKAMQKIQPSIALLKEKHKEDAMTLNREMMSLMKNSGANPLGGCLPMLIQIPIFFALYRAIGSSVELYQSPFIFWIKDLSAHDPYFVLPIIMAVAMFLQQKLTPTTMDPMQAKVLAFMPLVFSLFMLNLPSGLTLYMSVNTIFGIAQQYFMLKERKA